MFDSAKIQPYIAFTDLREWMREAEKLGELKTVLGASWQEEIGLATDVVVPPAGTLKRMAGFTPAVAAFPSRQLHRVIRRTCVVVAPSSAWSPPAYLSGGQ